jgi:predicted amidophosphoribosyltransferase
VVDTQLLYDDAFAGTILIATLLIALYVFHRMRRRRREQATGEANVSPESLEDRAFNQIALARTIAERLARAGVDVGRVTELIQSAEKARSRRDFDSAIAFARSAQETLAHSHAPRAPVRAPATADLSSGPARSAPRAELAAPTLRSAAIGGTGPTADEADEVLPGRLPKNQAESRFQISLLVEELARTGGRGSNGDDAQGLLTAAQSAYDKRDFTEALRLSLRGRRAVGAHLETLPPSAATRAQVAEAAAAQRETAPAAESPSAPASCPACGSPLRPNDKFCRGCGQPVGAARCSECGEPLAGDDRFCGACGAPIRS